ncbi:hypothetical protein RJ639_041383 [Escallonia herrerae]|uniref:NPF family transporter n=1 Tax=Escallonia herrerae TaxID=1293975 RepID=A0AA88WGF5_9ASTE|nr:hypothetical protein RJ639_041383 [Escallonia herrerae]
MITYLTQQLNLPLVKASNILTNFAGTASLTPIIGALIADSFAAVIRYQLKLQLLMNMHDNLHCSSSYRPCDDLSFDTSRWIALWQGMICITISAVLPRFRPPSCPTQQNCKEASTLQLSALYVSLLLTSIGMGGTRPCVVTFAADQLDMSKSKTESRNWNFFNWYWFSMAFATLTALTVVVYIQDQTSWGWGLGLPTVSMGIAILAFLVGSPLYNKVKPGGSPLVRLAQVVVAAVKKRKAVAPANPGLLYENRELDASLSFNGRLLHTNQFKWIDQAAIVTEYDPKDSTSPNLWRLATVHRVEELKSIIRILPISAAGILLITATSHNQSFAIQQARSMDRHLSGSFEIPPASMAVFSVLTVLLGLTIYERLFVPIVRRFTGNPAGITCLQRMGIGLAFNILSTVVSVPVEIKRKAVATDYNLLNKPTFGIPISVFWLVPQYCLHGVSEVFYYVGHLEFLYDQSPESMRSTAMALYWITVSIGNYLGTFMVSLVHKYTGKEKNWLPDRNLNKGKLEYYYWLVSALQVLNLLYFVICSLYYTPKPLEEAINKEKADEDIVPDEVSSWGQNETNVNEELELARHGMV